MKNEEVLLGIDYGKTYIGLAIGKSDLISTLNTIENNENTIDVLKSLIENENITRIVIGLPIMNKKDNYISRQARSLGNRLKKTIKNARVEYVNEYLTSKEALNMSMRLSKTRSAKRKNHSKAAAKILSRYFDGEVID